MRRILWRLAVVAGILTTISAPAQPCGWCWGGAACVRSRGPICCLSCGGSKNCTCGKNYCPSTGSCRVCRRSGAVGDCAGMGTYCGCSGVQGGCCPKAVLGRGCQGQSAPCFTCPKRRANCKAAAPCTTQQGYATCGCCCTKCNTENYCTQYDCPGTVDTCPCCLGTCPRHIQV